MCVPKRKQLRQDWESADGELTGRVNTDLSFDEALDVLLNTDSEDQQSSSQ